MRAVIIDDGYSVPHKLPELKDIDPTMLDRSEILGMVHSVSNEWDVPRYLLELCRIADANKNGTSSILPTIAL